MKAILLFLLLTFISSAGATDYPTDGDNWTETYTTGWSIYNAASTATLDNADKQVGANSIKVVTSTTPSQVLKYDIADADLSAYDSFVFWMKVNKTLAWRATYSVYLDVAGNNRWEIAGNLPTTWTKITLAKADMTAGDFSAVSMLHWDWNGEGHPVTIHIDGVHFETAAAAGTPNATNLDHAKGTTWVNHTWAAGSGNVTDSYNVSINSTWHNGTTNTYYNNTPIPTGNWSNITVWAFNSTAAPSITSYAPTGTIWPEVQDSQLFNVTVNQSTQCRWYVNGSLAQTNATPSLTHAYTNTSLNGGGCNVTAVCNNTNGSDSQSWIFEVGADSISYIILQDTPTNQSMIKEIDVTRIGSNVTDWGIWQNHTFDGWTYYFRYTNGTEIKSLTASGDNDTLWFNHTSLLPTGVYFINASNVAPVITNLTNSTPKTTSVTITWDTDISSDNRVYYGTNETEINAWTNGTWSSWHNSTTSMANTTYYYKPESRDVAINQSVAAENFTTAESTGIETFVNPSFISTGATAILFVAAAGRFAIRTWRNRRRKRRN
jgi:hypothetical protein